jgi:hypothetical protein
MPFSVFLSDTFHLPFSTKEYVERILTPFNDMARKITQGEEPRRNAVVLDLFGGIGTSLVCLKRNKIAIDKVIVVEHDKVAVHVYKSNHDSSYNEKLPDDGIKYIYINKFEEIYDEHNPNVLQAFLEKYKRKSKMQKGLCLQSTSRLLIFSYRSCYWRSSVPRFLTR